jgi:hypothetical protein
MEKLQWKCARIETDLFQRFDNPRPVFFIPRGSSRIVIDVDAFHESVVRTQRKRGTEQASKISNHLPHAFSYQFRRVVLKNRARSIGVQHLPAVAVHDRIRSASVISLSGRENVSPTRVNPADGSVDPSGEHFHSRL